ncbi:MAG: arylesterase [Verrucomicrobia bacterium]|nr:arylesterase [Verrucomicrobiota bacterium]
MLSPKSLIVLTILALGSLSLSASKTILFMGDSITAGYGIGDDRAFPALIQEKLDEGGFEYTVMNAGVSGDTSAGGLSRTNWLLKRPVDIFVLELGANDGLRGQSVSSTRANLSAILVAVKEKYSSAKLVLAGMQVPPNMGPDYSRDFRSLFKQVADETGAHLIPFILEGVGGIESLNQPDGIHPNLEGHGLIAELVWKHLEPLLEK